MSFKAIYRRQEFFIGLWMSMLPFWLLFAFIGYVAKHGLFRILYSLLAFVISFLVIAIGPAIMRELMQRQNAKWYKQSR